MLAVPILLIRLMDQFSLSLTEITSLWTMCYFIYGVTAFPAGFLADKWNYKAALMIFLLGTFVAMIVMGMAQSVVWLGIGMALLGFFGGFYHPSALAMISRGVRQRGKALGLQGIAGNIGLALSPIIVGFLAIRLSLANLFYTLSLPCIITSVAFIFIMRNISKETYQPVNTKTPETKDTPNSQSQQRLRIRAIILLYAAMSVAGFTYQGMTTMLPTYLDSRLITKTDLSLQNELDNGVISEKMGEVFTSNGNTLSKDAGISIRKTASRWTIKDSSKNYEIRKEGDNLSIYAITGKGRMFTTMILLVGILGQYMGGNLSDKHRKTLLYFMFSLISMPFMLMIGLSGGVLLIIVAALFALFHFSTQPVENNLIAQYTPSRIRSSSYGLKFVFSFGVGSFASAFSGYIGERFGLSYVFIALGMVICLLILLTVVLVIFAKEKKP
jgi:MFS family permease